VNSSVLRVLSVFPEICNVNGDAENAAVLAARSRWAGHSARVVRWSLDDEAPTEQPGIVILGSAPDVAIATALAALTRSRSALAEWIQAGVPILAIGTGWEMLSSSIDINGERIEGLGLVPGRAVTAPARVSDDLVVASPFGRLIGYENHSRDYQIPTTGADVSPLGDVLYGRGNGATAQGLSALEPSSEGMVSGSVIGTHLHGPVLAKNPGLADHILQVALGEGYDARTVATGRVDDIARAARNVIATRLEFDAE
jgi:CobQ-like glutamine amidotransferase family enzyme